MNEEKHTSEEAVLINEIKKIKITSPETKDAMIHNPTDLPIMRLDKKTAVIRIDATRSATFFRKEDSAEEEYAALLLGASLGFTPKVYGLRGTYVVTEIMEAPTLADHLEQHSLTPELTEKLLQLLDDFQKAGYTRLDHDPAYIHVMPDGNLKVVNVKNHIKLPRKMFPKQFLIGMGKQITEFLNRVKILRPALYQEWSNNSGFEETIEKALLGNDE